MKPSDFKTDPVGSIFGKAEAETVSLNILKILARNGNEFRLLSWAEYYTERIKDGDFNQTVESKYFQWVFKHCSTLEGACEIWSLPTPTKQ